MTPQSDVDRFLRAAVKTGLRLQKTGAAEPGKGAGVRVETLKRIKVSLKKRTPNPRTTP